MADDEKKNLQRFHVIHVNVFLSSITALFLGFVYSSYLTEEVIHWMRGYRWNTDKNCITDWTNPYADNNICRPLENCSTCDTVYQVEEFQKNQLTEELFLQRFAYTNRPVVVRLGADDWPAIATRQVNFAWLKNVYLSDPDALTDENMEQLASPGRMNKGNCTFLRYKYPFLRSIRSVVRLKEERMFVSEARKDWFASWSICQDKVKPKFNEQRKIPKLLKNQNVTEKGFPILSIGTKGGTGISHRLATESYFYDAQITGEREVTFAPPPECRWSCHGVIKTILKPGDLLFHSSDYWNQVSTVVSSETSISLAVLYGEEQ